VEGYGLARRGLLVRHLVMPDAVEDAAAVYRWLASEISPETYLNVMDQYRPEGSALRTPEKYPELSRPLRESRARGRARGPRGAPGCSASTCGDGGHTRACDGGEEALEGAVAHRVALPVAGALAHGRL